MKNILFLICIGFACATVVQAEDAHSEPKKATRSIEELTLTCVECHGTTGMSDLTANPNIGGQHRDYLLISMKRYQTGERENAVMTALLAGLSEEELELLAVFYSQQDGLWDTAIPRFK